MSKSNKVHDDYVTQFTNQVGDVPDEIRGAWVKIGNKSYGVENVLRLAIDKAATKATSAAYGGQMGDGGARAFVEVIQAWVAGLQQTIPPTREFSSIAQNLTIEHHPEEWAEYNRLKKVFGGA